jgi:enamine deaminase RidA (YjgF/YER057c/UK114 family)
MRYEKISAPGVPEPKPRSYTNCKKVGDQVFISGMVAWDEQARPLGGNDAYEQSRIIFGYIRP